MTLEILRGQGAVFEYKLGESTFKVLIPAAVHQSVRGFIAINRKLILEWLRSEGEEYGEHRSHCAHCIREIYLSAPLPENAFTLCPLCKAGIVTFQRLAAQAIFQTGMPLCSPN